MADTRTLPVELPNGKPPDWANSMMRWALTVPVIQNMVGQGVALLSFKGRKTGRDYTIPVSYDRTGDTVTVITKRQRRWWHNFETPLDVELRLAGRLYTGKAEIEADNTVALDFMTGYLARRPIDARAYGLAKDEVIEDKVSRIIPGLVIIRIAVTPLD